MTLQERILIRRADVAFRMRLWRSMQLNRGALRRLSE